MGARALRSARPLRDIQQRNEVNAAIDENARMVVADILARSPVVKKAVDEGKTKIVIMKYHLETGEAKVVE